MLRFFRLFFVGMTLVFLIACGGGNSSGQQDNGNSSSVNSGGNTVDQGSDDGSGSSDHQGVGDSLGEGVSEESNTSGNIGSGNCITVSRPIVGQTLRYGNPSPTDTSYYHTIQEWTIIEFSNTSSSVEIVMTGDFLNGIVNETTTYSISNNYMDITKYIQQSTINSNSVTTTIEFKPFQRIEIDTVCKDQTWTSSFELSASTTAANGANYPSATQGMTEHYTIESINETKSVAAGTFNTYRKRMVDNHGAEAVSWIDTKTRVIVCNETYDSSGALNGTMELLSID